VTSRVCSSALLATEPARYTINYPVTVLTLKLVSDWCCLFKDQQELEGSKFKKLCSDCGLVDKKFTVTDVDLTFAKVQNRFSGLD